MSVNALLKHKKMKKYALLALVVLFATTNGQAQPKKKRATIKAEKEVMSTPAEMGFEKHPKLIVGLIVDQMRYDYLTRYWNRYGEGGFKRLVRQGFNAKNHHFNYAPTSTGPGHASVYTGASPSSHGVIGNNWYSKVLGRWVYCAGDSNYQTVGSTSNAGKMSPHRMQTTTMTDQLRLHTQQRGKVIAVAIKDRGAVLPGGHSANAAYWFEGGASGNWISSSYYMEELPMWVKAWNDSDAVEQYKRDWTTLEPVETYTESGTDVNSYEGFFKGEKDSGFPHKLSKYWEFNGQFSMLRATPYGNSLTMDFALEALKQEELGQDTDTDFLAVSFSSTDYAGHFFGVNSKEVQDVYMRLDKEIERLLNTLDAQVGEGEYTLFLTADHGAIHVPSYLKDQKLPGDYWDKSVMREELTSFLEEQYGTDKVVSEVGYSDVFLNRPVLDSLDLELDDVQEEIAEHFLSYEQVYKVYTGTQLWEQDYSRGLARTVQNGWHQKRSGDVIFLFNPGVIDYPRTGSTHGSAMIYDTHVPLLFYGAGIRPGSTAERTEIPDIAPTISVLMGMAFPSGTTGQPISAVLK